MKVLIDSFFYLTGTIDQLHLSCLTGVEVCAGGWTSPDSGSAKLMTVCRFPEDTKNPHSFVRAARKNKDKYGESRKGLVADDGGWIFPRSCKSLF